MLAFSDGKGEIYFGDKAPPGGRVLADHSNSALLRAAVLKAGASFGRDYRGRHAVEPDVLLVPWYGIAKPDDAGRVEQFAARVVAALPYDDSALGPGALE